jgi:hypothetical protein
LGAAVCGAALLWKQQPASAALHYGDIRVLRFLEEVEELQKEFFTRAALSHSAGELNGREREVINTIALQDDEHLGWFALARGQYGISKYSGFYTPNASRGRPPRVFTLPIELFTNRARLLDAAVQMKEVSVGAYQGQLRSAREPRLLQSIASLAGVEARHAAALREVSANGDPTAAATPLSAVQVMDRLREYGFRGETML